MPPASSRPPTHAVAVSAAPLKHTRRQAEPVDETLAFMLFLNDAPEWRNGRRGGLKIRYPQGCEGSTPFSGTIFLITTARYFFIRTALIYLFAWIESV